MSQSYETETGYYVIRDADGRVVANADVSVGSHQVPDISDMSLTDDVDSPDDFESIHPDHKFDS